MRRVGAVVVALMVVLAFVFAAAATEKGGKAKAEVASGEVVAVDTTAKTLTVKTATGEMVFDVANAKLVGYKALDEIKAADKVEVKYEKKADKNIALEVVKK